MSLIPEALGDPDRWTPQLRQVAARCGLGGVTELLQGADESAVFGRKVAAYLLRTHGLEYAEIGRVLGKHRSTIHVQVLALARVIDRDTAESKTLGALMSDLPLGTEGIQR